MNEEKVLEERKGKLKDVLTKNNYVLSFSLIAVISFIIGLASLVNLVASLTFFLWISLAVASLISAVLAYYGKLKLAFIPIIIWLLLLAWHTRTINVPNLKDVTTGDYTLGPDLDPFLFLRSAKYIVEHGSLEKVDMLRYVPLGFKTADETQLLPYMIAYFHKALVIFKPMATINYSAVMFPVFMFLLTVISFFLFVRKIFEDKKETGDMIALISTAFLILSVALLPRTIAGIPEKESAGFFFLFLALYLFISAWKSKSLRNSIILGFLSGLSTALMGLIWGGWIYIFITIGLFGFFWFIFGEINKTRLAAYTLWLLASIIIPTLFSNIYTIKGFIISTSSGLSVMVFFLLLVHVIVFKTRIKDIALIRKTREKIPDKLISIIIAIILGIIFSTIFLGLSFIPSFASDIINHLTTPYSDRLSFTVAENRQPYFSEWADSFGPIILLGKIPLVFWLFILGSMFLIYESVKNLEKRTRYIVLISYIIFVIALIFSRYSSQSIMNGTSGLSKLVYFGGVLIFGVGFLYIFYKHYKENKLGEFEKINFSYFFLLAYFIPGLIGARSAIRLMMALSPSAAALAGYSVFFLIEKFREQRGDGYKMFIGAIMIIFIASSVYALYYDYNSTIVNAKAMVPSAYTVQWQKAMAWVRTNTPENAVFGSWWDYGYWIQSIGNRATMLDGGNAISYWDYLMGRYGLTAQNEKEALDLLYSHNVSYFLIDSTDIGKYSAYSNIGSDENYDRYSWIQTFFMIPQATAETKNETAYSYYIPNGDNTYSIDVLDEDYMIPDKNILLPSGRAGVASMTLNINSNNNMEQPDVSFVYQNARYNLPLRYVYYLGKLYDFGSGYGGCLYVFPEVTSQGIKDNGAAMFLSERNMRALWVKLYLLNEGDRFEIVHEEQSYIVDSLRSQGYSNLSDIIYYDGAGLQGPIKIWKVNYAGDEKVNPEYIQTYYPASIQDRRNAL